MRESPSLVVVPMLQARGPISHLLFYSQSRRNGEKVLPRHRMCRDALHAAKGADVTVVLTEWNEFRALELEALRKAMRDGVLVDLRNLYPSTEIAAAGFIYHPIGCGFMAC